MVNGKKVSSEPCCEEHVSKSIGVGKGFVVGKDKVSTQQDILFYDTSKPVLYQEGDLLILTPEAALGAIEVKTNPSRREIQKALTKLANTAELVSHTIRYTPTFFGLFAYDGDPDVHGTLERFQAAVKKNEWRVINCLSIGSSFFVQVFGRTIHRWIERSFINAGIRMTCIARLLHILFSTQ